MLWKLEYNAIKNTINLGVTDDGNKKGQTKEQLEEQVHKAIKGRLSN